MKIKTQWIKIRRKTPIRIEKPQGSGRFKTSNYVKVRKGNSVILQYRLESFWKHFYSSKSLAETDLDPEYHLVLSLNRSFYEGVKNTKDTTIDGDSPIVVRTTTPTVAVPFDAGDSNLRVIDND